MTKISLELDAALDKRLKQYALDHYTVAHGKQQQIIRDALIAFLDANESKRQPKVIEIQPESEEVIEVCEPEPAPKPRTKKVKTGGAAKPKTKGLSEDQKALALIKELWENGERNRTEIGRKIGYAKHTAIRQINAMIEAGELKEETEPETANIGE